MNRIIFGDNQFFGINHMSEDKAIAQAQRFATDEAILRVIDTAYELGVTGFMFTPHDRVSNICDHFRANRDRYPELALYPALPYAHKYANAVAEKGIIGTLKDATAGRVLSTLASGGAAVLKRDPLGVMKILVDTELVMFRELPIKVVFLQNIVTDLMMGLGQGQVLKAFADHVSKKHGVEAGFITMNMPKLLDVLEDAGVENPIICSSINKIGYMMNPGRENYERVLRNRSFRPLAMSVLASGAIPAPEALEYVTSLPGLKSIVFGASSRANIQSTRDLIRGYDAKRADSTPV